MLQALAMSRQKPERHLRNTYRLTRGIAFFGTPQNGSGLADWAEALARFIGIVKQTDRELVQALRRDSEVLARIKDSFFTMMRARNSEGLPPIEITCFYEQMPLPYLGFVCPASPNRPPVLTMA